MLELLFIASLAALYALVLPWCFRHLPREQWQILATLPRRKAAGGHWHGTNLTVYGAITATAYAVAAAIAVILLGAVGTAFMPLMLATGALLAIVIPASSQVARWVEGKSATFTVGGAAFVGIVAAPWLVLGTNAAIAEFTPASPLALLPTLAAFAIAYTLGEGTGRLACISFGCCYGKPLAQCSPRLQRVFAQRHFVFVGASKKISYEGRLDGHKVVPIQALTCGVYVATALVAIGLFLHAAFAAALLVCIVVTQGWRVISETWRADWRGDHRSLSAYQIMALIAIAYVGVLVSFMPTAALPTPRLAAGLAALWTAEAIVALQALAALTFWHSGRSVVTRAEVSIHLCPEHI